MKIETSNVIKLKITELEGLDPITVILEDIEPRKGKIIIECYGKSWSAYWGGMGDRTVAQFFCSCNEHYLAGNLAAGLRGEIPDFEGLRNECIKIVCKRRRSYDIDSAEARELFDTSTDIEYYSSIDALRVQKSFLSEMLGDEWWYSIPVKPNPEYQYLCRIIKAVKAALVEAEKS